MVSAAELKQPLSWSARGDTTRGLRELEALAALAPDDAAIQNALGSLHAAGGAFDQASLHFRRALELRPRYLTAGVNLGTALLELGALNESLALLEIAVTQPDGPAPAEVSLGRALCLLGCHADAQIALERALTRNHAHAGTVSHAAMPACSIPPSPHAGSPRFTCGAFDACSPPMRRSISPTTATPRASSASVRLGRLPRTLGRMLPRRLTSPNFPQPRAVKSGVGIGIRAEKLVEHCECCSQ